MVYAEHRYIQSSKFKNLLTFSIKETKNSTGPVTTGQRFFAFADEANLEGGYKTDEKREVTGIVNTEDELDIVLNYSDTLYLALARDRKDVSFVYQQKKFYPVKFSVPENNAKYLKLTLRRSIHG